MDTTIQTRIDSIKALLDTSETNYQHAMASGDWDACTLYKSEVAKYRKAIGSLVKQKLGMR